MQRTFGIIDLVQDLALHDVGSQQLVYTVGELLLSVIRQGRFCDPVED